MNTQGKHATVPMGPLERASYDAAAAASRAYRRHVAEVAARPRGPEAEAKVPRGKTDKISGGAAPPRKKPRGFGALRHSVPDDGKGAETASIEAPTPGRIAARLLLARLFDQHPQALERLRTSSPVVLVDVPDLGMHHRIVPQWQKVLGLLGMRSIEFEKIFDSTPREKFDLIHVTTHEALSRTARGAADAHAFAAIQLALPILAITPSAARHLSQVLLDAAVDRLMLPPIDAALISRVIAIVTGKACRAGVDGLPADEIGLHELLLAVRFDRTPAQCVEILRRLTSEKSARRGSRDLTLDELHGLDDAVGWAKSTIRDIDAWRRGDIAWDAVDAGAVLQGPTGTGKTTFARVFAAAAGLPLVSATLAGWQGSGEGHLGHLLRAMRRDFDEARAKAPCVLFIDEIDSFANRASLRHAYRDYSIEVVNGFLAELDGIQGRQGLVFIGASNDLARCDPAILRAGRLNRIIHVRLPNPDDIEKMLRVRLRGDLADESLEEISLLAVGSSGADIERFVKDGRRRARQEGRPLASSDIRRAVLGGDYALTEEQMARAAVHEAGHLLMTVLHRGPAGVHGVIGAIRGSGGFMTSPGNGPMGGTLTDCRKMMAIILGGRAAEETEFGSPSIGSGGNPESDLAKATEVAAALVGSHGLAGPHPLVYIARQRETAEIMAHPYIRHAVHRELAAALEDAKRILGQHRGALREVADRLLSRRRADGFEVEEILARHRGSVSVVPNNSQDAADTPDDPDPAGGLRATHEVRTSVNLVSARSGRGGETEDRS